MNSTSYSSVPATKSHKKKSKNPPSQLAEDTFAAFQPFINVFDCGTKFLGNVYHSITKEDWRLFRRHKQGEQGLSYPDGRKFNPYLDVVQGIYSAGHVHQHLEGGDNSYYTSGKKGLGLLYLDIDAHKPWQTDEYRAKAILQDLFPFGYFRCSGRGQNGYLKIRYSKPEEFNALADRLEQRLRRHFLSLGILCDVETKGTMTTKDKSGDLAKLPFGTKNPCQMKDETDHWDQDQLEKFIACPLVSLRQIDAILAKIEIDEEKADQCLQEKRKLDDTPEKKIVAFVLAKLGIRSSKHPIVDGLVLPFLKGFQRRQQRLPTTEEALDWLRGTGKLKETPTPSIVVEPKATTQPKSPVRPCSLRLKTDLSPQSSDDAFRRNLEDLRPFCRAFYSEHRRFPTTEEALDWLKANGRYSGEWEDREDHRAKRVEQILQFTERTFDPELLSKGGKASVKLDRGRFGWWVRQHFGSTMMGKARDISRSEIMTTDKDGPFDTITVIAVKAPTTTVSIPAKFVETFLAVADFCLKTDPLSNKAVPTNRIKKIWAMVKDGCPWNQKHYRIVRDRLHRMGVISIIDRHHQIGKAWRWESGASFPSKTWKEEQRKFKEEHRLKAGLAEAIVIDKKNNIHNSLYYAECQISTVFPPDQQVRPPP